ncbi:glycosyltransferase family 4 protein [Aeromonas hydrophila]|uniref:glycosyltransferase family 4 protein n=1 Tax=Aeromonas hydrophila TaxID=644 RepID=UPI003987F86E
MKKTVWYISKYFATKTEIAPGGRGWFLLQGLKNLGHNVIVVTSDSNALIEPISLKHKVTISDHDGLTVVWLKTIKYTVAKSFKRVLSWFDFEWNLFRLDKSELPTPDVIVVSSLSLLTILNGFILRKRYGCRLMFEIRDIWPLTIIEEGGFSRFNPFVLLLSFIEKLGYRYSDAIIGTMPNLSAHVANVCDTFAPVYCIPMGISPEAIESVEPIDAEYIKRYLSSNKFKIVYAGTIGITNALDVLFETANRVKSNMDIEFLIVGDGPLKSRYMAEYGHLPNVIFAPKVTKNQVQTLLSYCDIVYFSVFPSKVWEYGQSLNKVIDYMLSGKPIVASYDGYPSMINEAGCGDFVPAGDVDALQEKIIEFFTLSDDIRNNIGRKGKAWLLENRSYEMLSRQLSDILFK